MFHKNEAQRVIAISLGKIASYRNQRGGSSLHKNLMVANVLHKVRSFVSEDPSFEWEHPIERVCMPESSQLMALDDFSMISQAHDNQKSNLRPNEDFFTKSGHVDFSDVMIGSFATRDAGNGCDCGGFAGVPVVDFASQCEIPETDNQRSYTQLKSGSEYDSDSDSGTPRIRCLKRRQEDTKELDPGYAKRIKFESEFIDISDTSWRLQPTLSDTDSESESDSLDIDQEISASGLSDNSMDSEQISSLVSVFKCSFHGLGLIENSEIGACDDPTAASDYGYSSSNIYVQELCSASGRDGKPNALRRGLSLPDLCAKQADLCQTFQLTAPVLALTV